jgi:chorismate mutase
LIRGIRGATTVDRDEALHILTRTEELILEMAQANAIDPEMISSICFTMTPDLHATFPAEAARRIGWKFVPVICMRELDVPHSLLKVIRVLMQAESPRSQQEIRHIYHYGALALREDLLPQDQEPQG